MASYRLVETSRQAMDVQRIATSLSALRYEVLGGRHDAHFSSARAARIGAELTALSMHRAAFPPLEQRFPQFSGTVYRTLTESAAGSPARYEALREVEMEVDALVAASAREREVLESVMQHDADRMRRWLLALVSSAVLLLVVLYGAVRRLNLAERAAKTRFAYQAMHDALTGLANRTALVEHLDQRLADADIERALGGFAVMLVDLDGFKEVNDQHGHQTGDALLREVSTRMRHTLRDTDFLARLGGDEFMVVIPQVSDRETAARIAEKLVSRIAAPYALTGAKGAAVGVSASIGISMFPQHGTERETLMKSADEAMYAAKHAGRNQFAIAPQT
jgi:diguanylate cyclase (GGDEF)-like protein